MNVIEPSNLPVYAASLGDSHARLDALAQISQRLLDSARSRGATQAEVSCSEESGLSVNVRMGEVETVESTRDRGISVTVYFGKRKGSASTADLREDSLDATVEQACAIARKRWLACSESLRPWREGNVNPKQKNLPIFDHEEAA